MQNRPIGKIVGWGVLVAALVLLTNTFAQRSDVFNQLDLLVDVRHELMRNYVEEPDAQKMTRAAVEGMVESVDDPYTRYLPPEELKRFNQDMRGEFSGIGAQVDMSQDRLRIVTPLEDSPAWEAGVMAGDIVLEVDGQSTLDMSLSEAVDKLKGKPGTDVTIRVRHENGEEETITITRAKIDVHTVRGFDRNAEGPNQYLIDRDRGIGYIRISQFSRQTAAELREAIETLKQTELNGLILDLRLNPGGLLDSAVAVSDMFLQADQQIVSIKGRTVEEETHSATSKTLLPDLPVVVLANEASASAAEIVTGALKDNDRAHVIGTRTFGKGSVQQVRRLESNQGAIKITNAYYYLPSGRNIHRRPEDKVWGVDPSEGSYIPMDQEAIRAMIEARREQDALRHESNGPATRPDIDPAYLREKRADPQLAAALEAMLGKLDSGDWPEVGQSGANHLAQANERRQLRRQRDLLQEQLEQVQQELSALGPGAPATQPGDESGEHDASSDQSGEADGAAESTTEPQTVE
jgi:carboxyl-terminal processing protease